MTKRTARVTVNTEYAGMRTRFQTYNQGSWTWADFGEYTDTVLECAPYVKLLEDNGFRFSAKRNEFMAQDKTFSSADMLELFGTKAPAKPKSTVRKSTGTAPSLEVQAAKLATKTISLEGSVADVKRRLAPIALDCDMIAALVSKEQSGRNRKTLVNYLEAMCPEVPVAPKVTPKVETPKVEFKPASSENAELATMLATVAATLLQVAERLAAK